MSWQPGPTAQRKMQFEMSVGRPRQNRLTLLAVLGCAAAALLFAPLAFVPAPVQPPLASQFRLHSDVGSSAVPLAASGAGSAWISALLGGGSLALGAAAVVKRGVRRVAAVTLRAQRGGKKAKKGGKEEKRFVKDADDFKSGEGAYSFISGLKEEDVMEEEDKAEALQQEEEEKGFQREITGDSIDTVDEDEEDDEAGARRGQRGDRQMTYNLYPSRKYVMYIAKKNAQRAWTKDGPDGVNKGCIEVQIAILTERIRNMVLHARENIHDFAMRIKLVSYVARRRALLDKLSWRDTETYLKIRDELKIRHVYRMEALIGRLPEYKYAQRDRKRAPGRKVAMRLKKSQKLLQRRLANQIRQGKPKGLIHLTKQRINARRWYARSYDVSNSLVAGREPTTYIDPLDIP